MSPAPVVEEVQPDPHLDQLQAVGKAFDALLLTLYRLTNRHNELKAHTEEIFKQVITTNSPPRRSNFDLFLPFLPQPDVSNDERI